MIAFCAFGLYISETRAITSETIHFTSTSDLPGILEKIELQGELMYSVGPNAIEAGASKEAIYIEFKQSCGNVDIFIYNENGLQIYGTTVNTSVQQMLIIPIVNITYNSFTVMLSNASGCADGEFNKN